jgi:hypothetical protein
MLSIITELRQEMNIRDENSSYPGSLIKSDLDELGQSVGEAARALGISQQQLRDVIAGCASVTPEMAVPLRRHSGARPTPGSGCKCTTTWRRLERRSRSGIDNTDQCRPPDWAASHKSAWLACHGLHRPLLSSQPPPARATETISK